MRKGHTVTLHHVITVYNDMFNVVGGIIQSLAKKKPYRMEDMVLAMKIELQTRSKYYAAATTTTCTYVISVYILDPLSKW
jgi:hypothetical protein